MAKRINEKLSPRFFSPYPILEKIRAVAYKLYLLDTANIHLVFHVSQLCKAAGPTTPIQPFPSLLSSNLECTVQPACILGIRPSSDKKDKGTEVFVQWQNLPFFEALWEPYELINPQFPKFYLGNKVLTLAGVLISHPYVLRMRGVTWEELTRNYYL